MTATGKNQSGRPKQFLEDGLRTTSVSEYKTSAWGKYGHTQGSPAEPDVIINLIPYIVHEDSLEHNLIGLNRTVSERVIVGLEVFQVNFRLPWLSPVLAGLLLLLPPCLILLLPTCLLLLIPP